MLSRRRWILLAVLAGIAGLIAALPYLLPLSSFIPEIERAVSEQVRQPVKIGALRLFVLPLPSLRASAITVGRGGLLEIDTLIIRPSAASLFGDVKVIREIELRGVRTRPEVFAAARMIGENAQRKGTDGAKAPPVRVRVDAVTLRELTLRLANGSISGLNAFIRLQDNKPTTIKATHQQEHLQVTAKRGNGDTWNLEIAGRDWKLPVGLPLQFDRLEGNAIVNAAGIESQKVSGSLYGGGFSGPVVLHWKSGWSLRGAAQIEGVDLKPLVALVNKDVLMTGTLNASPSFSSQAREAGDLLKALQVESDFAVEHGVLHKVDLVAATKNPLDRQAAKGGSTQFDELNGHFTLEQGEYAFSDLEIASGVLKAQGDVTVHADKKLSGVIRAELRGTGSIVGIPFDVSGTTSDPSLFPTKGAMAGAAVGTVIMPGLGTAVGIKAGELTERLFGSKKKEKSKPAEPAPK